MPIPNVIKYSTTPDSKSLKVGNFSLGVSNSAYGETSSTGYWNGISPPTSGYTIYENKVANGPSIRVPSSSAVLIDYANRLYSGSSITTEEGALSYFNGLNDVICTNINYEEIVTSGLTLLLDAGFTPSYPKSGTSWTDLSFSGNNGTLINGPTFNSSNGGSIVFDGVDDYVGRNTALNVGSNFSVFAWVKPGAINVRNGIVGNSYPYSSGAGWYFSTATNYGGTLNTFFISVGNDNAYRTANNSSITLNAWNYIGGTVTNGGQNIKLYVNGIETSYLGGLLTSNTITYTTPQFYVGRRVDSLPEPFIGSIATTQIYNRILSSQEILQNFNAQKSRFGL